MFNISPLDYLNKRKLSWIPEHFSKINISNILDANRLDEWIQYKLLSRYSVLVAPAVDVNEKLKPMLTIAFEDEKELTYFMLACPYLRR